MHRRWREGFLQGSGNVHCLRHFTFFFIKSSRFNIKRGCLNKNTWIITFITAKYKQWWRWGRCCMRATRVAHRRASAPLATAQVDHIHLAWPKTTRDVKASYKGNGNGHFFWFVRCFKKSARFKIKRGCLNKNRWIKELPMWLLSCLDCLSIFACKSIIRIGK